MIANPLVTNIKSIDHANSSNLQSYSNLAPCIIPYLQLPCPMNLTSLGSHFDLFFRFQVDAMSILLSMEFPIAYQHAGKVFTAHQHACSLNETYNWYMHRGIKISCSYPISKTCACICTSVCLGTAYVPWQLQVGI